MGRKESNQTKVTALFESVTGGELLRKYSYVVGRELELVTEL